MPPPVTPSPHRFLPAPRQRNPSTSKESRKLPNPALPRQTKTSHETPQRPTTSAVPSSQFASTPKFGAARAKPAARPSPPQPSFAGKLRSVRVGEGVEDDGEDGADGADALWVRGRRENGDGEEMLMDAEEGEVAATTEREGTGTTHLPFSPKRRRLDADDDQNGAVARSGGMPPPPSTPARLTFKPPPESMTHNQVATPRFVPPSVPAPDTFHPRPAFLYTSPAPAEPSAPLPEAFSPHRRGNKFVPGGLAATCQQWVVETGSAAVQSRRGMGYLRGEEFVCRVRVEGVRGGDRGVRVLEGRDGEREVGVILVGGGREGVERGMGVGVRAPSWEVGAGGRKWIVGVDWRVLP